jgi:hypothetical protein
MYPLAPRTSRPPEHGLQWFKPVRGQWLSATNADSFVCWKQLTDHQIDEAIAGDVHWETGPINQIQTDLVCGAHKAPHQNQSKLQTCVVQFGDLMVEQSNHPLVTTKQWALCMQIGPNSVPNTQDMMAS